MSPCRNVLATLAVALLTSGIALGGSVVSGPQVGEKVPGPFTPLCITGPEAGQKACQYCKNGSRPVAVVFARGVTPAVALLLKKIDTATAMNKENGLASYAVICSDMPGVDQQLLAVAQQMQIQNTVLTRYTAGGPEKYRLSPDADVTILLYNHFTVKGNYAFKVGELTEAEINAILADLGKMLSEN